METLVKYTVTFGMILAVLGLAIIYISNDNRFQPILSRIAAMILVFIGLQICIITRTVEGFIPLIKSQVESFYRISSLQNAPAGTYYYVGSHQYPDGFLHIFYPTTLKTNAETKIRKIAEVNSPLLIKSLDPFTNLQQVVILEIKENGPNKFIGNQYSTMTDVFTNYHTGK